MKKIILGLGFSIVFIPYTYANIPCPLCLPEGGEKVISYQEIEKETVNYSTNLTSIEKQMKDFLFPSNVSNIWVKRTDDTIELVGIETFPVNNNSASNNTIQSNQAKLTFYTFKWQLEPIINNNSSDPFKVFIFQWYQKRKLQNHYSYPIPPLHIRFLYPINKPQTNQSIWGVEFNKCPFFCLWVTSEPNEIHDFEFTIIPNEVIATKTKKGQIKTHDNLIYDESKIHFKQTNNKKEKTIIHDQSNMNYKQSNDVISLFELIEEQLLED